MSSYDPYAPPGAAPRREPAFANFGNYFSRAFHALGQRWQDWVGPMLVAAAVWLAAFVCCFFPVLLAAGPLSCGLFTCALRTLRGQQMDTDTLRRGWDRLGTAIAAFLVINLLIMAPFLLTYAVMMCGLGLFGALAEGAKGHGGDAGAAAGVLMLATMAFMMLAMFGSMIWMVWVRTRTIFVMPLIADRDVGFSEAWHLSWQETRHGFWELLLFQWLAGLIGMIGMYVCYVGVVATLPIYFTLIAAAYEHRFAPTASVSAAEPPPGV